MSTIDEKVYSAIENNLNIVDKLWFNNNLQFAKAIYNIYDVEYNFENILDIIKKINIVDGNDNENIHYDEKSNTLILGKSQQNIEYNLCKSFLQITSQNYDSDNNSYNNGLVYKDENGQEYGQKINDLFINELVTINTGLSEEEDESLTPINSFDTIIKDLLSITGSNKLVSSFVYGQGHLVFDQIASIIGADNTKHFYNSIDNYEKNPQLNQIIYNMCINAIINSKSLEETIPKM